MPPTIKARGDLDGCGCLACRNIETTATRRTVLDALLWSVRLFRAYPSLVAFGLAVVVANRLLETGAVDALPAPLAGGLEAATAFAFVFLLRAYVATIVAGELTGRRVTFREGLRRSLSRAPALVGLVGILLALVMVVPFLVSLPLFALLALAPGNPVEILGFPAVAAIAGGVFLLPLLLLAFKFWFAPEACVVGRYGPVDSLRISWRLTTDYRRKLLLVCLVVAGSAGSLYVLGTLPVGGASPIPAGPVFGAISASVGELLSVAWTGAYAHIYVQGIVEIPE